MAKQFRTVSGILNRDDVDTIYVCTDSGREGEYIYRLVEQGSPCDRQEAAARMDRFPDGGRDPAGDPGGEGPVGIRQLKCVRLPEGQRRLPDGGSIFSRLLTLKYGNSISSYLKTKYAVISVGRVMTCVARMVVRREREIREFVKTPFYRVISTVDASGHTFEGEWRAAAGSRYAEMKDSGELLLVPELYKENGFKEEKDARALITYLSEEQPLSCRIESVEKKKEKKNPPLLYNLAELQNDCSRRFKISPDETLRIVQELYEKKLVTYPRTDARVLSTAVAKEISRNLNGLSKYPVAGPYLQDILQFGSHKNLAKNPLCQ